MKSTLCLDEAPWANDSANISVLPPFRGLPDNITMFIVCQNLKCIGFVNSFLFSNPLT